MANVNHSSLTDPYLHEPKGAAAATQGQVYVANGAGSGSFKFLNDKFSGFLAYDAATPAYQHAATTSDAVMNPTITEIDSRNFSLTTSPNMRITYNGTSSRDFFVIVTYSLSQTSGASRDVELVLFKNGSEEAGSRIIRTTSSGAWGSATMSWGMSLTANDYVELAIQASASTTIDFAKIHIHIQSVGD